MITKKNYVTANFIDEERKNIEILLKDGDITRPHIIEADEDNSDYKALLKIVTVDELHEQTHQAKKAEGDTFKAFALQVAKESGFMQQEENLKIYPTLVKAMFNNDDNDDDIFALKLALFEVEKIRESKNTALKTKLRKAKSKVEILRFAFDIIEEKLNEPKAESSTKKVVVKKVAVKKS
jgi:hypothetical protein